MPRPSLFTIVNSPAKWWISLSSPKHGIDPIRESFAAILIGITANREGDRHGAMVHCPSG